ncbi:unnamed protein product [Rotaria socialis]
MNLNSHRSIIDVHGTSVPIRIYHNGDFPYEHVHSVLGPLFENYYGDQGLRNMFASVDHIWCAYDIFTDHCVGCVLVQSEPDRATLYIKLLGVRRMSQGQGVGARLLDAVLSWAKSRSYIAVLLHTQADNYKAIGLYQKLGFRKQAYLPDFFHSQAPLRSLLSGEPNAYMMVANLDETSTL